MLENLVAITTNSSGHILDGNETIATIAASACVNHYFLDINVR